MRFALTLFALLASASCSFDDAGQKFITTETDVGLDTSSEPDTAVTDTGAGDTATTDDTGTPDLGIDAGELW